MQPYLPVFFCTFVDNLHVWEQLCNQLGGLEWTQPYLFVYLLAHRFG